MKTLGDLAADLATGAATSLSLVEGCLERIADPAGEGSRTFLHVDAEGAREAARHMDALRRRHRAPSPYAGIPISVKDLFDVAGEVTTAGSVVLKDAPPAASDAPAIARLRSAGFVVLGRTNMTEFAYSGVGLNPHYGTPRAPYDRASGRIPGGSSSGAAVSVADDHCALGIGTDTGGSTRIPASFCGIVGFKPSVGRIPTTGVYPLSSTLDSVGPLARSVACAAVADAVMALDWTGSIVERPPGSLRLGIVSNIAGADVDREVSAAFDAALQRLSKHGATLSDVPLPEADRIPAINSRGGISAIEAFAHHRQLIEAKGGLYDPRVCRRIQLGAAIPAPDYVDILRQRARLIEAARLQMQGFDGVLLPTTPNIPPPIAALAADEDYMRINFLSLRNTFVGNFLNCCAISLPVSPPGAPPAGLMIMAPWGRDRELFSVAAAIEPLLA